MTVYEHPNFSKINEIEVGIEAHTYDLEEYYLPPVVRKVLKTTKTSEIVEIRTTRKDKAAPHFDDPHGIFKKELLSSF